MSEDMKVQLSEGEYEQARVVAITLACVAAPYNANGLSLQKSIERAERALEAAESYVIGAWLTNKARLAKTEIKEEERPSEGQADGDSGE